MSKELDELHKKQETVFKTGAVLAVGAVLAAPFTGGFSLLGVIPVLFLSDKEQCIKAAIKQEKKMIESGVRDAENRRKTQEAKLEEFKKGIIR